MLFVSIIYLPFIVSTAKGLKICEDCVKVKECAPAHQKVMNNWNNETRMQLENAKCQELANMRICCSDFYDNPKEKGEAEIENHRNIHLIPDNCGEIETNRIFGGEEANLHEFPWLALLERKDHNISDFTCGGSLITSRHVLTAAHCLASQNIVSVRIGDHDLSKTKRCYSPKSLRYCEAEVQDIRVSQKIIHPQYSRTHRNGLPVNDIALLRLKTPVNLNVENAGLICLPVSRNLRERSLTGDYGTVAGWGWTTNNARRLSTVLQKADVPISSRETCGNSYLGNTYDDVNDQTFKNILCADEEGIGSCKGDSGSPLMIIDEDGFQYIQYGIVSYGISCGTKKPSIYTDVTKYLKWILDSIKP